MADFSELPFAALFAYHTNPSSAPQLRSRDAMLSLKQDKMVRRPGVAQAMPFSEAAAHSLTASKDCEALREFLGSDATLVPIPGHSLSGPKTGLWVPDRIAKALQQRGFGAEVVPMITRSHVVAKSAYAAGAAARPTPQEHHASFTVSVGLYRPKRVLLVDDIVTRGSTALGAAASLRDALPGVNIALFAVMRAPRWNDFKGIRDPTIGRLRLSSSGDPEVIV